MQYWTRVWDNNPWQPRRVNNDSHHQTTDIFNLKLKIRRFTGLSTCYVKRDSLLVPIKKIESNVFEILIVIVFKFAKLGYSELSKRTFLNT